jgi:GT2 family glycosyltransferase
MKVHIVIPVHNNVQYTLTCLRSIAKQKIVHTVTVIDDGSKDGTTAAINKQFPETTVLRGNGKLWWTAAVNRGIFNILKNTNLGDFILSLNNDVTINVNYLSAITKLSRQNKRAIVGSFGQVEGTNRLLVQGGRFDWANSATIRDISLLQENNNTDPLRNLDFLHGRGLLIPIEVFHQIGVFNNKALPHYWADSEFTWRAKKAGWELMLLRDPPVKVIDTPGTTGLPFNARRKQSWPGAINLLFSRKSKLQIVSGLRFIHLCCPARYRLKNYYFFLFHALRNSIGRTFPLRYLIKG